MDAFAIVSNIATLASLASSLTHNTTLAAAASVAREGMILVDEVKGTLELSDAQALSLDSSRNQFEAAVNAHAERTAASLG